MKAKLLLTGAMCFAQMALADTVVTVHTTDSASVVTEQGPMIARSSKWTNYDDLAARCSNVVTDIIRALNQANNLARMGQMSRASALLVDVLNQKASEGSWGYPEAPHTETAIVAANDVAKALVKSTSEQIPNLGSRLVGEVRFITMTELFKLVISAYENLDKPFYLEMNRGCNIFLCRGQNPYSLPQDYYNGVAKLAQSFINLQQKIADKEASDYVELSTTAANTHAARLILVQSVYRREFACVAQELKTVETEVQNHLCSADGIPTPYFVEQVRSELQQIRIPTHHCGW